MDNYKFSCDKCNYKTNLKMAYKKHLETTLHKTGKRKVRSDKKNIILKCELCDYTTINKYNYNVHMLNNHLTKEEREKQFKFYCNKCDFGCFTQTSFDIHLSTKKHKIKTN